MRGERRGFTLLETMVVLFITGLMLPAIGTAFWLLLRVPPQETGKLTTINDVQAAFNWIRDDAMRAQYYSGSPSVLDKVVLIDFDNSVPETDCWAWEDAGPASSRPDPGDGTLAGAGDYNDIAQSDSSSWVTDDTGDVNGDYNYQVYQLTVNPVEYPVEDINRLTATWVGHGEGESGCPGGSCDTTLMAWNYETGSWDNVDSRNGMGGDGGLSGQLGPPGDYLSGAGEE